MVRLSGPTHTWVTVYQRKFRQEVNQSIRSTLRDVVLHSLTAASIKNNITEEVASPVADLWMSRAEKQLKPFIEKIYKTSFSIYAKRLINLGVATNIEGVVSTHLDKFTNSSMRRIESFNKRIEKALRDEIIEGLRNGENNVQLRKRISGVFEIVRDGADAIAEAQIVSTVNGSGYDLISSQNMETQKVWNTILDARTRETHRNADGQKVEINQLFTVGGYEMRYPGDPDAPIEETANCRCGLEYEFPSRSEESA